MNIDFEWDSKKAEKVFTERGIRFEDIEGEVKADRFMDVKVKNQKEHPDQRMFVVRIEDYAVCAPYVKVGKNRARLVTAFKSRVFNKEKESSNG